MNNSSTIVEKIRTLANSQGLSLPNLEIKLGMGNGTISRWSKSSPNTDKLLKIADHFHVSVDYLLGRETPAVHPATVSALITGKQADKNIQLSATELELIQKFRRLDVRGRSAVMNVLNYEYTSLAGDEGNPLPKQA